MIENIKKELLELIKLTTPFTIFNQKFNEMDLIRHALKLKKNSAPVRLHDDYRKMEKI